MGQKNGLDYTPHGLIPRYIHLAKILQSPLLQTARVQIFNMSLLGLFYILTVTPSMHVALDFIPAPLLSITNNQGNSNQNHESVSLPANGYCQKDKITSADGCLPILMAALTPTVQQSLNGSHIAVQI